MKWLVGAVALMVGAACAPTSVAPSVIRMEAAHPQKTGYRLGLRTGPRVSQASASLTSGTFRGDTDSFNIPEWSAAYDFALTVPLGGVIGFHAGVQAEFFYPIPMAALGGWLGFSTLFKAGPLAIAPAIAGRISSDFGIRSVGGPATIASGDASITLSWRIEEDIWVGVVPFFSYGSVSGARSQPYFFAGGWLIGRVKKIEVMGGWGRVFLPDGRSWNVPLIGVRAGDN